MKIDLTGRTALVTGSAAGIGFAIAQGLADAGATVIVHDLSEGRVAEAIAAIREAVPVSSLRGHAVDISNAAGVQALIAGEREVDILVNNVGIFEPKAFFDISDADWGRFFETNVMSGVRLSRAYMPGMLKRNWGRVVFISSESAINVPTEAPHYGITKTAQLAVARGLAELTAGTGVTVNSVLPGPTRTESLEAFLQQMAAKTGGNVEEIAAKLVSDLRPTSLIQRLASAEEVANMVVYLRIHGRFTEYPLSDIKARMVFLCFGKSL